MHNIFRLNRLLMLLTLLMAATFAQGAVVITDAWVRASSPGQSVGAAYLTLTATEQLILVYAETERADSVEMHRMTIEQGVMKMRSMDSLLLPAAKPVKLAPGGLHLMMFELTSLLKEGEQVKFRLCFKDKQGKISEQFVTIPVKAAP